MLRVVEFSFVLMIMFAPAFRAFWDHAVLSQLINASDDADTVRGQFHVIITNIDLHRAHVHRANFIDFVFDPHPVAHRDLAAIFIMDVR